jgi:site-specific DNA-methyltransferase (adenine-specific)
MILHGDCLEQLKKLEANSVDAVVSDPPYGLSFMGKKWDYDVPSVEVWREVLRVLKPGGHALIACGTRTQHRMVVNIEDAGFEIRDVITWLYGSGFPKSMAIDKAIDKAAGAKRADLGPSPFANKGRTDGNNAYGTPTDSSRERITAPATPAAKQWQGWGTALKPACEFWTLARKPIEGTVASNVLKHGTGGLNIDATRIAGEPIKTTIGGRKLNGGKFADQSGEIEKVHIPWENTKGRFPSNLILDEGAAAALDEQSGTLKTGAKNGVMGRMGYHGGASGAVVNQAANEGGASRFFYVAKVSPSERKLDDGSKSNHPTVKPVRLMRYLCRLITPSGGLVLDPFTGSGSTGVAALLEGFRFLGIEREAEYVEIAEKRLQAARFEAMIDAEEKAKEPEQVEMFQETTP